MIGYGGLAMLGFAAHYLPWLLAPDKYVLAVLAGDVPYGGWLAMTAVRP